MTSEEFYTIQFYTILYNFTIQFIQLIKKNRKRKKKQNNTTDKDQKQINAERKKRDKKLDKKLESIVWKKKLVKSLERIIFEVISLVISGPHSAVVQRRGNPWSG